MLLLMAWISSLTAASPSDERATSTMHFGPLWANEAAKPSVY
jgi:hypothetical protein